MYSVSNGREAERLLTPHQLDALRADMKGVEESLGKCLDEMERSKRDPVSICSVSESNTGQVDDPKWSDLQKDLEDLRTSVEKLVEAGLRRHRGS